MPPGAAATPCPARAQMTVVPETRPPTTSGAVGPNAQRNGDDEGRHPA